jgi:hypothetical protein
MKTQNYKAGLFTALIVVLFSSCKKEAPFLHSALFLHSKVPHVNSVEENKNKNKNKNKTAASNVISQDTLPFEEKIIISPLPHPINSEIFNKIYPQKIKFAINYDTLNFSKLSSEELYYKKLAIYAAKGFFFRGALERRYFEQQKWYQPIYWDNNFCISLNAQEKKWIQQIEKEEKKRAALITESNKTNAIILNSSQIINQWQYPHLSEESLKKLKEHGVVLISSNQSNLTSAYFNNYQEQKINYYTVDYLAGMAISYMRHLETSLMNKELEEKLFFLFQHQIKQIEQTIRQNEESETQNILNYNLQIFKIASQYLEGRQGAASLNDVEWSEAVNVCNQYQQRQISLSNNQMSGFAARKINILSALHWLQISQSLMEKKFHIDYVKLNGFFITSSPKALREYNYAATVIQFLYGLQKYRPSSWAINHHFPFQTFFEHYVANKRGKDSYFLFPPIIDWENKCYSRLIFDKKGSYPSRIFPRALDWLASLGNKNAEAILKNYYMEHHNCKDYEDSLGKNQIELQYMISDKVHSLAQHKIELINSLRENGQRGWVDPNLWSARLVNTALCFNLNFKSALHYVSQEKTYLEKKLEANSNAVNSNSEKNAAVLFSVVEQHPVFWRRLCQNLEEIINFLNQINHKGPSLLPIAQELRSFYSWINIISQEQANGKILSALQYNQLAEIPLYVNLFYQTLGVSASRPFLNKHNILYVSSSDMTKERFGLFGHIENYLELFILVNIGGRIYIANGIVPSYHESTRSTSYRINPGVDSEPNYPKEKCYLPKWLPIQNNEAVAQNFNNRLATE